MSLLSILGESEVINAEEEYERLVDYVRTCDEIRDLMTLYMEYGELDPGDNEPYQKVLEAIATLRDAYSSQASVMGELVEIASNTEGQDL